MLKQKLHMIDFGMKKIYLILLVVILALFAIFIAIFLINSNSKKFDDNKDYFGISGFAPTHYPTFTDKDAIQYWKDINNYANIFGVHSSLIDSDSVNLYQANLKIPMYLLIDAKDIISAGFLLKITLAAANVACPQIGISLRGENHRIE